MTDHNDDGKTNRGKPEIGDRRTFSTPPALSPSSDVFVSEKHGRGGRIVSLSGGFV
jgi:hypothetical protein